MTLSSVGTGARTNQEGQGVPQCRVILVEDEMIVLEDLRRRLVALGYDVVATTGSGREAVEKTAAHRPDVVVMDISLRGEMDGVEAAERIFESTGIPVVYVTGLGDPETMQRAQLMPGFSFVLKPVDDHELKYVIQMALHRRTMSQQGGQ
jgi:CheY-like chemotaxis protein